LPLAMSNGTEAWSCTISQLPSRFWKQKVPRTHIPLVAVPSCSVPLSRPKACPRLDVEGHDVRCVQPPQAFEILTLYGEQEGNLPPLPAATLM